jgi:hypothetical protein
MRPRGCVNSVSRADPRGFAGRSSVRTLRLAFRRRSLRVSNKENSPPLSAAGWQFPIAFSKDRACCPTARARAWTPEPISYLVPCSDAAARSRAASKVLMSYDSSCRKTSLRTLGVPEPPKMGSVILEPWSTTSCPRRTRGRSIRLTRLIRSRASASFDITCPGPPRRLLPGLGPRLRPPGRRCLHRTRQSRDRGAEGEGLAAGGGQARA